MNPVNNLPAGRRQQVWLRYDSSDYARIKRLMACAAAKKEAEDANVSAHWQAKSWNRRLANRANVAPSAESEGKVWFVEG